jgi:hypothetical protein
LRSGFGRECGGRGKVTELYLDGVEGRLWSWIRTVSRNELNVLGSGDKEVVEGGLRSCILMASRNELNILYKDR